ncbi:MAG: V-type ATP synthase subunit E [Candidatus Hydrogenedentes bacterium]|nr:V-type ATP synthase subunit E [Candidatus Hydrogenedentota bacterium]
MAGQDLFETMRSQTQAECESRLAEARRAAEDIRAAARRQADVRQAESRAAVQTELDHLARHGRMIAEAEAEKATLAMENDVVEEILAGVRQSLEQLAKSPEFGPVVEALLAEVMADADPGVVALAPPAHVELCRRWLQSHGHAGVTVEASQEVWDGVAIQDNRKSYRVTNTLSSRCTKLEGEARRHCMTTLFAGGR